MPMRLAWLWLCTSVACSQTTSCNDDCPDQMSLLGKPAVKALLSQQHPNQINQENQAAWYETTESMIGLDFSKIQWPENDWHDIAEGYQYGGGLLLGLLYQAAITQANKPEPNGTLRFELDGLKALDKILSGIFSAMGPWGKVLSGFISGAFALFGGQPDMEKILKEALEQLYEKIMEIVKEMFNQQQVQSALRNAGVTLTVLMGQLSKLP